MEPEDFLQWDSTLSLNSLGFASLSLFLIFNKPNIKFPNGVVFVKSANAVFEYDNLIYIGQPQQVFVDTVRKVTIIHFY